ncbi:MAG: hypothetical protein WA324_28530 [Bryobacteraceae bacterium]
MSGIGHVTTHLDGVEVADGSIAPGKHAKATNIVIVGSDIAARMLTGHVGYEREVRKATLLLVLDEPLDRRSRGGDHRDAIPEIGRGPVPDNQKRRAHRTGRLTLRTVHHTVDQQCLLIAKEAEEMSISPPGGKARTRIFWARTIRIGHRRLRLSRDQ